MKRQMHRIVAVALAAGVAACTIACRTVPEEIPEGLSRMEMFQRAQEAVEVERWETALRYYEEFIRRFPDERGAIVEAEYEIAFIAYKQEQYRESIELFEAILQKYEEDETGLLPEWPRVLSLRLLEIIDERMFEEGLLDEEVPSA
ncbi:MAG: tetratricopeptide repeat protein [Spirochaetales bacterium]|nr:tetratricopeptide repeat protein [Spirochaetales bacterium]